MLRAAAAVFLLWPAVARTQPADGLRWFKGNTHAHTSNSDGDSAPDEVARWYREHGYHFLVLTDHNVLTPIESLNAPSDAGRDFLVIKGEELT
ncbi:MAG: PHP domain-containing protein, partial [Vicinamibacterales bacterium]